uniref:[histone H4]-lysine(20) N-methyltransferase n=1 Tax=Cyprinus carpio TaxID=7962 RepID=A0A8C2PUL9_CYPCA
SASRSGINTQRRTLQRADHQKTRANRALSVELVSRLLLCPTKGPGQAHASFQLVLLCLSDFRLKEKQSETNRKVTDYFPVRRSCRKSKAELKCEKQRHIDDLLRNNVEEGLKVKSIEGKGRGVFADRAFQKDQFVVEYHGDLLEIADAKAREAQYAQDPATGCYISVCTDVDATKESDRLGRLINHSKNGNLRTKLHEIGGTPHLIFLASRDIRADEELLYDYGDRSKEAVAAHPWLKH